jgi:amino acid transporter
MKTKKKTKKPVKPMVKTIGYVALFLLLGAAISIGFNLLSLSSSVGNVVGLAIVVVSIISLVYLIKSLVNKHNSNK